jgi:hypothetical protein
MDQRRILVARNDDDGCRFKERLHFLHCFESLDARQVHVEQHQIGRVARGVKRLDASQVACIPGLKRWFERAQEDLEPFAKQGMIVHDQHVHFGLP